MNIWLRDYRLRFSIYSWVEAGQYIEIEIFFVILDLAKVPKLPGVIRTKLAGEEENKFWSSYKESCPRYKLTKGIIYFVFSQAVKINNSLFKDKDRSWIK